MKKQTYALVALLMIVTMVGLAGCSSRKKVAVTIPDNPVASRETQTPQIRDALYTDEEMPPRTPRSFTVVYFDFDKSDIRSDQMSAMNHNAELAYESGVRIRIEGHCDERGTDEYNMALGQRRADAVREYLINYGVKSESIDTISYGEMRPAAQGHDESSWAQNRRGEFVILSGSLR